MFLVPILFLAPSFGASASAQDFWMHWGDGKAELNGYSLKQPRYGTLRSGTAVLVFVTEDFSDASRVKAEPGRHPAADVFPVLKLNAVRDFATGIYDYSVMTSSTLRAAKSTSTSGASPRDSACYTGFDGGVTVSTGT